jgi:hypothetical protein
MLNPEQHPKTSWLQIPTWRQLLIDPFRGLSGIQGLITSTTTNIIAPAAKESAYGSNGVTV